MQGVILAEAASSSVQTYLVGEDGIVKTEIAGTEGPDVGVSQFDVYGMSGGEDGYYQGAAILSDDSMLGVEAVSFLGESWFVVSEERAEDALQSDVVGHLWP